MLETILVLGFILVALLSRPIILTYRGLKTVYRIACDVRAKCHCVDLVDYQ